jgi:hypothetical protein
MQYSAFHCPGKHINTKPQKNFDGVLGYASQNIENYSSITTTHTDWNCSMNCCRCSWPAYFLWSSSWMKRECVCVKHTHKLHTHTHVVSISTYQYFPCTLISPSVVFASISLMDFFVFCDVFWSQIQSVLAEQFK